MNINDQYRFIFDNLKDPKEFQILAHIYKKHGPEAGIKSLLPSTTTPKKTMYDLYLQTILEYNNNIPLANTKTIGAEGGASIVGPLTMIKKFSDNCNPNNSKYLLFAFKMYTEQESEGIIAYDIPYQERRFTKQILFTPYNYQTEALDSQNKVVDFYTEEHGISDRIPVNCFLGENIGDQQPNAYIFPEFSAWFKLNNPCDNEMYQNGQFMQNGTLLTQTTNSDGLKGTFMYILWDLNKHKIYCAASIFPYDTTINHTIINGAIMEENTKIYIAGTHVTWTTSIPATERDKLMFATKQNTNINNPDSAIAQWLKGILV